MGTRWNKEHPEKMKQAYNKWYIKNKEKALERKRERSKSIKTEDRRRWHQKGNYGISSDDFQFLWDSQNGRCAICTTELRFGRGGYAIDHNHQTDKIRGLLCATCNFGLGGFKDSILLLNNAINYLEEKDD